MSRIHRYLEGVDINITTSLKEYGIAWRVLPRKNEIRFYYGVGYDFTDESYDKFATATIPLDTDPKEEWDFVIWAAVAKSCGMPLEDFLKQPLPNIVECLVSYYGHEAVFGSYYHTKTYGEVMRENR